MTAKTRAISLVVSRIAGSPLPHIRAQDVRVPGERRQLGERRRLSRIRALMERRVQWREKKLDDERRGANEKRKNTPAPRRARSLVP